MHGFYKESLIPRLGAAQWKRSNKLMRWKTFCQKSTSNKSCQADSPEIKLLVTDPKLVDIQEGPGQWELLWCPRSIACSAELEPPFSFSWYGHRQRWQGKELGQSKIYPAAIYLTKITPSTITKLDINWCLKHTLDLALNFSRQLKPRPLIINSFEPKPSHA